MEIHVPDPHPGRCINVREGRRCLHRDNHNSACVFPPPPARLTNPAQYNWAGGPPDPVPWIPPWEREPEVSL